MTANTPKRAIPDEATRLTAQQHRSADHECGRDWECTCAACINVRERMSKTDWLNLRVAKNPHAVALGRLGGAAGKGVTSERKSKASRANMQKAAQASAAKKQVKKEAIK